MFQFVFAVFTVVQSTHPPHPNEIKDALAHADALYYAARFNEAVALLTRIDESLKPEPERVREKIDAKLKLALTYIGLNDTARARSFLFELYGLDPDYVLDSRRFPPKVISAAAEIKAEYSRLLCFDAQTDARTYLEAGKMQAFLDLLRSMRSKCAVLSEIEGQAVDGLYKAGTAAYKRGDLPKALSSFESVLAVLPEHELALQYIDLIHSKQKLTQDRRKTLSALVEAWNRTCPTEDLESINTMRSQISELLPEPAFGEDIRSQMKDCTPPKTIEESTPAAEPAPPEPPAAAPVTVTTECLDMPSQLALTRLKTRVEFVITPEIRTYFKTRQEVMVRVQIRIDEYGDVSIHGMPNGNPILNQMVRTAVSQWKFTPARDHNGPRCVDTELPLILRSAK